MSEISNGTDSKEYFETKETLQNSEHSDIQEKTKLYDKKLQEIRSQEVKTLKNETSGKPKNSASQKKSIPASSAKNGTREKLKSNEKNRAADGDVLEFRMKRLIFFMGYYPKVGVLLRASQDENADPITDLDVYGTYIHKDFSSKTIWVDCKSGQSRPYDRITWIKGVQTTVQSDDIIFVKSGVRQDTKQYARKSGIQILDVRLIDKLEKDYGIKSTDWRGSWNYHTQLNYKASFSKISVPTNEIYKKISVFISSDFWVLDNYSRLKKSLTALKELSSIVTLAFNTEQLNAIKWAIYELVGLFTLAILNISKEVYYFGDDEKREIIAESIISSDMPLRKRIEIVDASFKIAYAKVKQQFPEFNPPPSKHHVNLTTPSYFDAFFDLILRVTNNPHEFYDILRFLDFVHMEYDLNTKPVEETALMNLFSNVKSNTYAAKTILHFIHQVTGIPREIFCLIK